MKTSIFKLFVKRFVFIVALVLGAAFHKPEVSAAPVPITACRTIDQPGSYVLTQNLDGSNATEACLIITSDLVTIDLAGFAILGRFVSAFGILSRTTCCITVRNGSIKQFIGGVFLQGFDNIVEGLRVRDHTAFGISATGIVRDNIAFNNGVFGIAAGGIVTGNVADGAGGQDTGITVKEGSTVTGNTAMGNFNRGIQVSKGSTVIGNTVSGFPIPGNPSIGLFVECPSNVIGNTATNSDTNLFLGFPFDCKSINNLAP
jgi:parallel beta-helix repeat protein